jgi:hypothetical protein
MIGVGPDRVQIGSNKRYHRALIDKDTKSRTPYIRHNKTRRQPTYVVCRALARPSQEQSHRSLVQRVQSLFIHGVRVGCSRVELISYKDMIGQTHLYKNTSDEALRSIRFRVCFVLRVIGYFVSQSLWSSSSETQFHLLRLRL